MYPEAHLALARARNLECPHGPDQRAAMECRLEACEKAYGGYTNSAQAAARFRIALSGSGPVSRRYRDEWAGAPPQRASPRRRSWPIIARRSASCLLSRLLPSADGTGARGQDYGQGAERSTTPASANVP